MIDVSNIIYSKLNSIAPTYKGYPKAGVKLPCISFYVQQNSDEVKEIPNSYCKMIFQVDIFSNRSNVNTAIKVNEMFSKMGFIREFMAEIPEVDINHTTMRFSGIINEKTLRVTQ